jgi:hypothetical protein
MLLLFQPAIAPDRLRAVYAFSMVGLYPKLEYCTYSTYLV